MAFRAIVIVMMILILPLTVEAQDVPPQDFQATVGEGIILLQWSSPSDSPPRGYWVYRSESNGDDKRLNPVLLIETFYQDLEVIGGRRYRYWVSAEHEEGGEGAPTQMIEVMAGGPNRESGY